MAAGSGTAPDGMTAAPQGRQADAATPRLFSGAAWAIVWVAVGAVLATILLSVLAFDERGPSARRLDSILNMLLAALGGFGVALLLAFLVVWWWWLRFISRAEGTFQQVVSDAAAATRAVAENDAAAAVSHTERALHEAAAWYAPIAARRFVVQTALGLLVTFGGLVGTGLLFRQTLLLGAQNTMIDRQVALLEDQNRKIDRQVALLEDQNRKIDLQTVTTEAQRRGGLAAELFSILQAVAQEVREQPSREKKLLLPHGLVARIVAFSRAATRYWTIEVPNRASDGKVPPPDLAEQPLSPERGQLLTGLVAAGVDVPVLAKAGATFADADLRRAVLSGADLSGADLSGAYLNGADLNGADLSGAVLNRAVLSGAVLRGANLSGAYLILANLNDANLNDAVLRGAYLSGAYLRGAYLSGAYLIGAYLSGAVLDGAIVGFRRTPEQLPEGFPKRWSGPPEGWETFDEGDRVHLRRVTTPPTTPSSSP